MIVLYLEKIEYNIWYNTKTMIESVINYATVIDGGILFAIPYVDIIYVSTNKPCVPNNMTWMERTGFLLISMCQTRMVFALFMSNTWPPY